MSTYCRRPQSSVQDGRHTMSSSSPFNGDGLSQNQNQNQTLELEDDFARLYVSSYDHNSNSVGVQRLGLGHGSGVANSGAIPSQNCWVGCDRDNGFLNRLWPGSFPASNASVHFPSYDSFLPDSVPFLRQREFGRAFPTMPLSNGDGDALCFDWQQKPRGDILNESFDNRLNIPRFKVNGGRPHWLQQPLNPLSSSELQGKLHLLARDQFGCRILQELMKNLTTEEVSLIYFELIPHVNELIVEPFGNYVVQKLVEVCNEEQMTQIILMVIKPNLRLIRMCLDAYGTRSVQKILEHVTTQTQRSLLMSALSPGAVALTKDINGHHVILHCLKHFSDEDNEQLLNVVANNCYEIAKDKSGCCVLQQCVNHAQGETKRLLIAKIIVNASPLAEDCYGNYVVQHLVSLKIPRVTESLLILLQGKFFYLSCNKYGSNVVEKFFQDSGEEHSARIIMELLLNPNVSMLLVDQFGNYVIGSALSVSEGDIRNAILKLIELNYEMMRSNLYGKKLLARIDWGKLRHKYRHVLQ